MARTGLITTRKIITNHENTQEANRELGVDI